MSGFDTIPEKAQIHLEKFRLSISDVQLSEFKSLLRASPLAPRTYENLQSDGKFGVTHEWMAKAKEHWLNEYDWRKTEVWINSFPNYTVNIKDDDGEIYGIHFVALFSTNKHAVPLLFLHGWPGSHLEFLDIIDLLRKGHTAKDLPFHIIAPSLPGYTLSTGPPLVRDFTNVDNARIFNKLMVGLGFGDGYIAQGGDVGSFVARVLARNHSECKAIHINLMMIRDLPHGVDEAEVNDAEKKGLESMREFFNTGAAYAMEHATRPATIGFVLASSPLALLAWVGEKFIQWTDETPSLEVILENVTLWWFTKSFPRGLYVYREGHTGERSNKPFGFSWFPKEVSPIPKAWVATQGNLVWHRQHDSGGHFAALEKPDLFLADIVDFVKQVWPVK